MYKLSLFNRLATVFRNKNLSYARKELDNLQQDYEVGQPLYLKRTLRHISVTHDCFKDSKKIYSALQKNEDTSVRVEGSLISIFSNDKNWITNLKNNLNSHRLLEFWEPDPKIINHLQPKTIVVEGPVEYKYKVTLGPKGEPAFAKWAEKNPQHIRIGESAKREIQEDGWVNGYYFYAKNDKTLQICSLMLGNSIRRIDTLVSKQDLDK